MRSHVLVSAVLMLPLMLAAPIGATPLFRAPAMVFDVGPDPGGQEPRGDALWAAAGDLNGDGRDDIVIANSEGLVTGSWGHTVSILLASAAPSLPSVFRAKRNYDVGYWPQSPAIGDFNGDSRPDIIVLNDKDSTVTILLGDGAGGFPERRDVWVGCPGRLFVCDLNANGTADLLVSDLAANSVRTFFGDGLASFSPATILPSTQAWLVRDLNGDGLPDLVFPSPGPLVTVRLGDGFGGFGAPISSTCSGSMSCVTAGDFDGDSILDLAFPSSTYPGTPAINILHGNGNGTFIDMGAVPVPGRGEEIYAIASGDLDADGALDLLLTENRLNATTVPEGANTLLVLYGDGHGLFPAVYQLDAGKPTIPLIGDWDGNGLPDIAAANAFESGGGTLMTHAVSVRLNTGGRGFGNSAHRVTSKPPLSQAVADVNRDGIPDLLVTDNSGYLETHIGGGGDLYTSVVMTPFSPMNAASRFAVGDLDRDGKVDVVASGVNLLYGNGDGTFSAGGPLPSSAVVYAKSLADLNRDGILDLILLGSSSVEVCLGTGGRFQPPISFAVTLNPRNLQVDDWNRDGKPDVAVATPAGIYRFSGNGDGTLTALSTLDPYRAFMDVTSGDFNRDGVPDLAARDESSDGAPPNLGVSVYLADGMGGFGPRTTLPAFDKGGSEIASWDVNRDGSPDLVASSVGLLQSYIGSGTFASAGAWLGNGTGTFRRDSDYLIGLSYMWPRVTFGDTDRDGQTDVLGANTDYVRHDSCFTYVSILRGAMPPFTGEFAPPQSYAASAGPSTLAVADFNRDGKLDVAGGGGTGVSVLLGNGGGVLTETAFLYVGDYFQKVDAADLDRDGDMDLVGITMMGNLSLMINNGQGNFSTVPTVLGSDVTDLALGDLNRDGIPDLVVCDTASGSIYVKLGTGAPGFGDPVEYFPSNGGVHVALGDVNRDGALDVVVDDPILGNVAIFLNDRYGGLLESAYVFVGQGIRDFVLVDLNRDGWLDIVASRGSSMTVLLANTIGGFGAPTSFVPPGSDLQGIGAGDVNADGIVDILLACNWGVIVYRGNGTGYFTTYEPHSSAACWSVVQADLDRDGRPDLVTGNGGALTASVLLGSDATPTAVAIAAAPPARPALAQNRPNPFNPRTEIRFTLAHAGAVQLRIFDAAGRVVATLADGRLEAGEHRASWDGRTATGTPAASGVYFYRLQTDTFHESKRMVLLR